MAVNEIPTVQQLPTPSEESEKSEEGEADRLQRALGARYKVGELIATGGMGAVYAGDDVQEERPVAIKVISNPSAIDPTGDRLRFKLERIALTAIHHPNVVDIYGAGGNESKSEPLYLVMERLTGITLTKYIRTQGTVETKFTFSDGRVKRLRALSLALALEVLHPMANGLRATHIAGFLHRDLKGDNIIVETDEMGKVRPVLIDLGLAKMVPKEPLEEGRTLMQLPQTALNMIFGTVRNMPPEQIMGGSIGPTDYRVDTYALATIFYEMLTGFLPYADQVEERIGQEEDVSTGSYVMAWFAVHARKDAYLPVTSVQPGLPSWLNPFFAKALERDPKKRFQTVDDFVHALETHEAEYADATYKAAKHERQAIEHIVDDNRRMMRVALIAIGAMVVLALMYFGLRDRWFRRQVLDARRGVTQQRVVAPPRSPTPPTVSVDAAVVVTADVPTVSVDVSLVLTGEDVVRAVVVADAGRTRPRRPPTRRCGEVNPLTGTIPPCFGRH